MTSKDVLTVILLILGLLSKIRASTLSLSSGATTTNPSFRVTSIDSLSDNHAEGRLLLLRGGASPRRGKKSRVASLNSSSSKTVTGKKRVGAAVDEKKSALADIMRHYKRILPLTRIYITMVVISTTLGLILGEELTQGLLALNPIRLFFGFEIWRPFTAASYLGPPSISWVMSGYYLFKYGSSLERAYGTAQFLVFLLTEFIVLTLMCSLLGLPFYTPSVITSMLHVLSRSTPNVKVKWLVLNVPYWSLPYGLMVADVLQAGNAMAAVPHILGILAGHFYYFHKFVWPKKGGEDWLVAHDALVQRLDPNARKKDTNKEAVNSALKTRKRGRGRKLGGK